MRLPRDISGSQLRKGLSHFGYVVSRVDRQLHPLSPRKETASIM